MPNYEIHIQVDIRPTDQDVTPAATPSTDGGFRIVINRESGRSIDQCEQALLAVHYPAIRRAVEDLFRRLPAGVYPDPRALSILDAYLNSYSFNLYGRPEAIEILKRERKYKGDESIVPWPEEALRVLGLDTVSEPIGMPQGGSLSCFLANAVMDTVDRAVRCSVPGQEDTLYLRYCDDIICIACSEVDCQRMIDAYIEALRELKLPNHPLNDAYVYRPYDAGFWDGKSKSPYKWAARGPVGHVPWCAFVGYQIRYDGLLRVRPQSIQKEAEKQRALVDRVIRDMERIEQKPLTKSQVCYRVACKLRSMAVGSSILHRQDPQSAFCWAQGFRLLSCSPCDRTSLRNLDRSQRRQLTRLRRALKKIHGFPQKASSSVQKQSLRFAGRPYSYDAIADDIEKNG